MKVWLVSFLILFALFQFVLWVKNFFVPLPFYVLGGACLALVSNYENDLGNFFPQDNHNSLLSSSEKNSDE